MNKKHVWNIAITFSLLLIVSACKKNTEDPQPPEVVSKYCDFATEKKDGQLIFNREFTADGKINKYTFPRDSVYTSFIYKVDSIFTSDYSYKNGTNVLKSSTAYKLNSDGNVVASLKTDGTQFAYTYDNNGYLITKVQTSSGGGTSTYTYSYTDGNLSSYSKSSYTVYYEYFTDKDNKIRSFGLNYGKQSKNLWKKVTQISSAGTTMFTGERTCDFDADGLPITEHYIYTPSSGVKDTSLYEYTYFCK